MAQPKQVTVDAERPLPHDYGAERAVLGAILLDDSVPNRALEKASAVVSAADFFDDGHRMIFGSMTAMAKTVIDPITITDRLRGEALLERAGGAAYVSSLIDGVPRVSNLVHYARIVREKSLLRCLMFACDGIHQSASEAEEDYADIIDRACLTLENIRKSRSAAAWRDRFHTVEELPEGDPSMPIDEFLPEGVTFFGSNSGGGKTWLALAMAKALHSAEKFLGVWDVPAAANVLYLCPEMNARAFKRRCKRFGIGGESFRCMTISDGAPLNLADPLLLAAIRELQPIVFLDTAIRFSSAEDENSASENAQGLAPAIFALLHAGARAVVCLHHRAKDSAKAEEMTLENVLRGTGDLGAMADAVYGLQFDRGDGSPAHLRESKRLIRLSVRCVKARDFRPPDDFRVQLEPYIDDIQDMAVLTDQPEVDAESEVDRLVKAIAEDPSREKTALERLTGIGRNRQEKLASERGWTYDRSTGWTQTKKA
jgi:hypothetical protein